MAGRRSSGGLVVSAGVVIFLPGFDTFDVLGLLVSTVGAVAGV